MVEPITNLEQISEMKKVLRSESERNYMLFMLGINLGLRVSDYVNKPVGFFRKICNTGRVILRQEKTDKPVNFEVNGETLAEIRKFIEGKGDGEWMFPSRKGDAPITRFAAWDILKKAAEKVGITENIGCHSMRKTFGYWYYQRTRDIRTLMMIFNHSEESVTLKYIGVTQEQIDNSTRGFRL